jgi:hypothetical protein
MTTYTTTRPAPPAALTVRIRKAAAGEWLTVPLLASVGGWVCVDDGQGKLWVLLDHVHRLDWPTLAHLVQLQEARN